MTKILVKEGRRVAFKVENDKCICTIRIGGAMVANPTLEMMYDDGWEDYVEPEPTPEELIDIARNNKLREIDAYDRSANVNGFILGGNTMWIVPADRTNYLNTLQGAKRLGVTTVPFLGMNIPVDNGIAMLDAINLYAMQCVGVTDAHRAAVMALTSVADIEAYDHTAGYPTMLNFDNL